MSKIKIRGYCDRPSAAPGESLSFYISVDTPGDYEAQLVRIHNGDIHPLGPGFKEVEIDAGSNGTYPGRTQRTQAGSYVQIEDPRGQLGFSDSFSVHAFVSAMAPNRGRQVILSRWDDSTGNGWELQLVDGALEFVIGDGTGKTAKARSDRPLFTDVFYSVVGSFDAQSGTVTLDQISVVNSANSRFGKVVPLDSTTRVTEQTDLVPGAPDVPLLIAGAAEQSDPDRTWVTALFNGKIDSPKVWRGALDAEQARRLSEGETVAPARLAAHWDFAHGIGPDGIPTDAIRDVSGNGLHGSCVNQPDRAMTGWNWTGRQDHFVLAPEQYGAIWFHEDSLDDSRWKADFDLTIPDLRSGNYAMRVRQGENEDYIPFFVLPPRGTATSKILVLMPTASYIAYANSQTAQNSPATQAVGGHFAAIENIDLELNERWKEYGLSTYDYHIDGRGVQYSSWRRPILSMRPKYRHEFGSVWQYPADLQLADWLTASGFEYDVATDHELMEEGVELFKRYNVVITGSHPEYYTEGMVDAWEEYLATGGRGMYLAGNGMYWVTAQHPEKPYVIEVRKGETGDQAWKSRPGELHMSLDGRRGGIWRRRARSSAKAWGVVYTSHCLDVSTSFLPMEDAHDPELAWMFEGIGTDVPIGDFGLVGGGAAGIEVDRYELEAGTPPNTKLVASSYGASRNWVLVPEEQYFAHSGMAGPEHPQVRGDIVYFSTGEGGAMFSSSSMAWISSLSWNNYENNVAQMTANVIRRFAVDGPLEEI